MKNWFCSKLIIALAALVALYPLPASSEHGSSLEALFEHYITPHLKQNTEVSYTDTVISNSVPNRPYIRIETPIRDGRTTLVKQSGVKITITAKGLLTICDYDNHSIKQFFKGDRIMPIIDPPEGTPDDDPLWSDPEAVVKAGMQSEAWVMIPYNRFDVYVDEGFYNSKPVETFEEFFDKIEPMYLYLEASTGWSAEQLNSDQKLSIYVDLISTSCVGGWALIGESYVTFDSAFPDILPECQSTRGGQPYSYVVIHEALHSISPLSIYSRLWLTEGLSVYYGFNTLAEFGEVSQGLADSVIFEGIPLFNWQDFVSNDYRDVFDVEIQQTRGYHITAWMFTMLRDNYSLNFKDFFDMIRDNPGAMTRVEDLRSESPYHVDMMAIDFLGKAIGHADFETQTRPIFRYDGPSGPGWGVRQWLPLDWYADLVPVCDFSDPNIAADFAFDFTSTILNNGDTEIIDVPVTFYNDTTLLDMQLISVSAVSSAVVTASFSLPLGTHTITVIVDEENLKVEMDDDNNSDSIELTTNADTDFDGVADVIDNCPSVSNSGQEDSNSDGVGDACCCGILTAGFAGNVNCDTFGKRNLADITELIDLVYISKSTLCCPANGNVDGDGEAKINLADITRLIDHVYISKNETAACE